MTTQIEDAKRMLRDKAWRDGDQMRGCTSYVSRLLNCGYNRAARIMEKLVEQGFISDTNTQGERRLLGAGETKGEGRGG